MIVKIMAAAGASFPGVKYNDKKIDKGKGELMMMKNFPSFINESSSNEEVKNYLVSVSKSNKVKKPQFHAAISTKFREHNKDELTKIAEGFMNEMGYGEQPFIIVFHNDTENNHVHIVSTRIEKSSGKKINDSYEKLKAQKALGQIMEKLYGLNTQQQIEKLLNYRYGSLKQLELLLERNGYHFSQNKNNENILDILKNGVKEKSLFRNQLIFTPTGNNLRAKQLKAILSKYKNLHSGKVFKVEDFRKLKAMLPVEKYSEDWKPKIEFESELQKKLRDTFGIDIIFHHKDGKIPFGYTLIDNKTGTVYKGSEILKMNELFEFTSQTMDKKLFESLKDYNISDETSKKILIQYLDKQYGGNAVKDFMLFETKKRKSREVFNSVRNDVNQYIRSPKNNDITIMKSESGKYYVVHSKSHYVGELEYLIGEKEYQKFLNPHQHHELILENKNLVKKLERSINDLIFQFSISSIGSGKDSAEDENKKRRKRKKR
ncbi:mobilization protein [Chryseobacterium nematophagum]|uniref:Mobilization protein n=1 Tax=Chryseobacterium nematophagum TaxID=2305228 RepID=A0A3M7TD29_9FLAO|nr:relaxase/mobilization nuclease domain-containing protein [Chryseobacterium nematophagum]RNA61395.1 mobilization protein [Chryseobacterium nematophagum]